jgi:hypothetical protein
MNEMHLLKANLVFLSIFSVSHHNWLSPSTSEHFKTTICNVLQTEFVNHHRIHKQMKLLYDLRFSQRLWTVSYSVTPCSLLSCNRRFGGTYRLHLQGRRNNFSKNQDLLPPAYLLVFAEITSSTLKMEAICSPKRRLQLNRLHGVTSQKMILLKLSYCFSYRWCEQN